MTTKFTSSYADINDIVHTISGTYEIDGSSVWTDTWVISSGITYVASGVTDINGLSTWSWIDSVNITHVETYVTNVDGSIVWTDTWADAANDLTGVDTITTNTDGSSAWTESFTDSTGATYTEVGTIAIDGTKNWNGFNDITHVETYVTNVDGSIVWTDTWADAANDLTGVDTITTNTDGSSAWTESFTDSTGATYTEVGTIAIDGTKNWNGFNDITHVETYVTNVDGSIVWTDTWADAANDLTGVDTITTNTDGSSAWTESFTDSTGATYTEVGTIAIDGTKNWNGFNDITHVETYVTNVDGSIVWTDTWADAANDLTGVDTITTNTDGSSAWTESFTDSTGATYTEVGTIAIDGTKNWNGFNDITHVETYVTNVDGSIVWTDTWADAANDLTGVDTITTNTDGSSAWTESFTDSTGATYTEVGTIAIDGTKNWNGFNDITHVETYVTNVDGSIVWTDTWADAANDLTGVDTITTNTDGSSAWTESFTDSTGATYTEVGTIAIDGTKNWNGFNDITHVETYVTNVDGSIVWTDTWADAANDLTGVDTILQGTAGIDNITTLEGADVVYALAGNDTINLSADSVWSSGYAALNVSNDASVGTHQKIDLAGLNRFSDVIDGGADVDTLNLTDGNDAFFIDDVYSAHHGSLSLASTTQGLDSIARILDLEIINAGVGNDIVDLTSDNFVLANAIEINGEAGDDILWGSNGNDSINGGDGNDSIFGGTGSDTLTGGAGADIFQFTATSGSDDILDFDITQDSIQLYYRAGDDHTNADLDLTNGILTWDVLINDVDNVVIDLSATVTSSDLNDLDALISFVEIV